MAFLYKHGSFPTLDTKDMSKVLLISAKQTENTYVMYFMVGEDVVLQTMPGWRSSLFERFCVTVQEEVAKAMKELKEMKKKGCVEKEGWVLEG
jgi:hypothetical protein